MHLHVKEFRKSETILLAILQKSRLSPQLALEANLPLSAKRAEKETGHR